MRKAEQSPSPLLGKAWCKRGVTVVSITQQIDLSGDVGHVIERLPFGRAEIEFQHSNERQAIGIALAKKRGTYEGRQSGTTKAKPSHARTLRKRVKRFNECNR